MNIVSNMMVMSIHCVPDVIVTCVYIKGVKKLHTFAIPNGNLVTSLAQCMSSNIFWKILAMCRENSSQYMSDLFRM